MSRPFPDTDDAVIQLLRRHATLGIDEFCRHLGVTATAVRQRLQRLLAAGVVQRETRAAGRGRPEHRYSLTEKGVRASGNNFGDLALALWSELKSIGDANIRRGLLGRIKQRLFQQYQGGVRGRTPVGRMQAIAELMRDRDVPVDVAQENGLPVLRVLACPYTELAEQDRSICSVERMLFADLVGQPLRLAECRMDGSSCCTFQVTERHAEVTR